MSNIGNLSTGHLDRITGQLFQGPIPLEARYRDVREVLFGDVTVMACGEYIPSEPQATGDFDLQAVLVGGVDIISGLNREQLDAIADQAFYKCKEAA
jgi:hypothetical protein